jgi:hypothetical protein
MMKITSNINSSSNGKSNVLEKEAGNVDWRIILINLSRDREIAFQYMLRSLKWHYDSQMWNMHLYLCFMMLVFSEFNVQSF